MDQVKSPMTVRIYHKQAQPLMQNKCENSECDHLCLPRAVYREKERVHEKTWHDRPFSCACEGTTASDVLECFADLETKSGISMFTIFLLLCVGGVVAAGFVIVRRKMGPRTFTALNFDNPIYRRTTEEADHQMEDPFRDPFAEPRNGRGRNDGLPTLASADNETRADALSF
ncbi:EGF-like domain-containing protein [Caenorhabditis elegans]|nr:EGF-like domain-containing protein [Caenorhabditis elegans]CAI9646114.1 EGF-like domain-containing protein [Caenorhabditis elegans]